MATSRRRPAGDEFIAEDVRRRDSDQHPRIVRTIAVPNWAAVSAVLASFVAFVTIIGTLWVVVERAVRLEAKTDTNTQSIGELKTVIGTMNGNRYTSGDAIRDHAQTAEGLNSVRSAVAELERRVRLNENDLARMKR